MAAVQPDGLAGAASSEQGATTAQPQQAGTSQQRTAGKSPFVLFASTTVEQANQLFDGPVCEFLDDNDKDAHDEAAAASIQQLEALLAAEQQRPIDNLASATARAAHKKRVASLQAAIADDTAARNKLQHAQFAGFVVLPNGEVVVRVSGDLAAHSQVKFFIEGLLTALQSFVAGQRVQALSDRLTTGQPSTAVSPPSASPRRRPAILPSYEWAGGVFEPSE